MAMLTKMDHFQEEETYLFSSVSNHLEALPRESVGITTKSCVTIFWRLYCDFSRRPPLNGVVLQDRYGEKQAAESLPRDMDGVSDYCVAIPYGQFLTSSNHDHNLCTNVEGD